MKISKKVEDRIKANLAKFKRVLAMAKDKDLNESDTVAIINDMLAEVFGYEKYTEITSELMIRGTYCDLAIRLDDKFDNGFLIECKRVGTDLKEEHMRQAVNYGVNKGIPWCVLTNGLEWRLYRLKFEQPVSWDLVLKFNIENFDPKNDQLVEEIYALSKEGVIKNAREEMYEKVKCVNRFVIGQLILAEPVVSLIRKELKKMSEGINVESEEVESLLRCGVLKRDIVDEEQIDTQNAIQKVSKFYKKSVKRVCAKKAEEQSVHTESVALPGLSVTEQLLAEAEKQDSAVVDGASASVPDTPPA